MHNEIPYSYGDEDNGPEARRKRERQELEQTDDDRSYDEKIAEKKQLNPRERKLAELRSKLKQSRNENRKAVIEEDERTHSKKQAQKKMLEHYEKMDEERREAEQQSKPDAEKQKFLNTTAETAEKELKKGQKKRKRQADSLFGWGKFTNDAQYNSYQQRQKNNPFDLEEYNKQKAEQKNFFPDANHLDYAQNAEVTKEKKDLMLKELHQTYKKRKEFSRRRPYYEDADVDFINERNRVFNKKIGRFYDPYTAEIKANLERGTAV